MRSRSARPAGRRPFFRPAPLAALTLFALAGCGADGRAEAEAAASAGVAAATADATMPAPVPDADALAAEIEATLQACSYDGTPVKVRPVASDAPSDCRDMVAQIMQFTGLPQNFTVVEAPVPNAAALIVLDEQRVPQRVIAFNRGFIDIVGQATRGNRWAPVSIMAHEIGHHLSGHTITAGGSQPPTELEADKFSGFVLYKMGATLTDAQTAMSSLVADGAGSGTHPGRGARLAAIREGWVQACEQQPDNDCDPDATVAAAPAPAAAPRPAATPERAPAVAAAPVDRLPAPDATPSKFTQFVYDELGVLDPTWRARFERQFYDHADAHAVELVTLLVDDLHGMSADDYAWAMLRTLRVGKLDVGNGAVFVVAPKQGEVGVAFGPGIALQMDGHDKKASLQRWLQFGWPECARKQACGTWTENLLLVADHVRRDTDDVEWTIRYPALAELMAKYDAYFSARVAGDVPFDLAQDPSHRKIVVIEGEVVDLAPPPGVKAAWVSETALGRGQRAVHVRSAEGLTVMLYMPPALEALMPGGALRNGGHYRFTARVGSLSVNPRDTQAFDLLSYDALN